MPTDYYGNVVCVGGCYGIASIYPIARALKASRNRVTIVVEARSSFLLYWQEKLKSVSDRVIIITRDGTRGQRGHVVGNLNQYPVGPAGSCRPHHREWLQLFDDARLPGKPAIEYPHHGQPEHAYDRRHRDVRCLPADGQVFHQIRLCGRPAF